MEILTAIWKRSAITNFFGKLKGNSNLYEFALTYDLAAGTLEGEIPYVQRYNVVKVKKKLLFIISFLFFILHNLLIGSAVSLSQEAF